MSHTPGPYRLRWNHCAECFEIHMGTAVKDPTRCEAGHLLTFDLSIYPEDGEQYKELKSTLELFAASPELLDLCEAQLESIKMMVATLIKITHSPLDDPTIVDLYEAMREAEAIIAKAKGEEGLV